MFLSDFALQQMKGTEHMKQVSSDHSINTENQRLEKKKKPSPNDKCWRGENDTK